MKTFILGVFLFALLGSSADAQMTCKSVSPTSQNCLVTATWPPGTPGASGFIIRRSDGAGVKTNIGTVVAPVNTLQNTFTDAGNVKHCWDVIATNSAGQSAPSPEACWTTPAMQGVPATPGAPSLSSITRNSMVVSWKNNSTNAKGSVVIRKYSGVAQKLLLAAPSMTSLTDTGLSANTTYRYQVAAFNDNGFSTPSAEATGSTQR